MGSLAFISSLTAHTYLIYVRENITDQLYLINYLFIPSAILSMFYPINLAKYPTDMIEEKYYVVVYWFLEYCIY